jgi:hypothetical protein
MATSLGSCFVEISLDDKPYKEKLSGVLTSTTATVKGIETSWKALGAKSEEVYNSQRRAAENAYTLIKSSALSTTNDIIRAEEAKNAKINALNTQQFGKQTSFLESLKANWIAASAAVYGAWRVISEGLDLMHMGAKAQQIEEAFKIVSSSVKESATDILAAMKKASAGTVADSDIMQKAVKGFALGLSGDQLTHISWRRPEHQPGSPGRMSRRLMRRSRTPLQPDYRKPSKPTA